MNIFYRVFVWSLNVLARGVFPHEDHDGKRFGPGYHPERAKLAGKPLAPLPESPDDIGYVGAFSEVRGDWKWLAETFNFLANYNTLNICHLCRAHKTTRRLLYSQFRRSSHIRRTCYSNAQFFGWLSAVDEDKRCVFVYIEGFHLWRIWIDAMHCLDLGVFGVLILSLIHISEPTRH
eukprot:3760912-Karenia_brevis.AAC.1